MDKITAQEARKLAGPTAQDYVNEVYPLIRAAATAHKRSLNLTDDFWVNGGYSSSDPWKEAKKILESDGFIVRFFYEERQFVNMFTIVEW